VKASQILFSDTTADALLSLDEAQLLDIMDGVPSFTTSMSALNEGVNIIQLLSKPVSFLQKMKLRKWLAVAVSVSIKRKLIT